MRFHGLLNLFLDGFEIEARTSLHRRVVDDRLASARDLLLREDNAQDFCNKIGQQRTSQTVTSALEGVGI